MNWITDLIGKPDETAVRYSNEQQQIFVASFRISLWVFVFGVCGIIAIILWAIGAVAHSKDALRMDFLTLLGADLLVAAAAGAAGGLFGFIFGIPRTLDPAAAAATAAARAAPLAASHAAMAANTNLERISDWLTTLLIGATLVQIKEIAQWVGSLGKNLVPIGAPANDAVVPIIVIYFFALCFLGIYLITRLYLTFAFLQALGLLGGAKASAPEPGKPKEG